MTQLSDKPQATGSDPIDELLKRVRTDEYGDSGNYNEAKLKAAILQYAEEEAVKKLSIYRADIAQAIGYSQGLGHPNNYLESRYPDITKLRNQGKESPNANP